MMPNEPLAIEANLRQDVEVIAGVIGERNSRRPVAIQDTREYIHHRLSEVGLTAAEYRYAIATREAVNLEVILPGRNQEQSPLVVGAHYDSASNTPGADDNASSVAALLQIIRSLSARQLRRTVRCVFYDCEEPPHFATPKMGSFQHARQLRAGDEKILGMICLESIGYFPRRVEPRVQRPAFIRWVDRLLGGRYVVIVSDVRSIPFGLPFVLRFATSGFFRFVPAALPLSFDVHQLSDHRSYWQHGYRALMVTNTALFRNPNYHQPGDLPDTLEYPRLATLTKMLTSVIRRTCG